MAKLIRSTKDCGYKYSSLCLHSGGKHNMNTCIPQNEQNFPDNCPLEDGIPFNERLQYVLGIHKKQLNRRHRCKCIYYLSGSYSKNNCKIDDRRINCSSVFQLDMVYPKCIGVNCGYYIHK
jgi:hypothetical protein